MRLGIAFSPYLEGPFCHVILRAGEAYSFAVSRISADCCGVACCKLEEVGPVATRVAVLQSVGFGAVWVSAAKLELRYFLVLYLHFRDWHVVVEQWRKKIWARLTLDRRTSMTSSYWTWRGKGSRKR